jgi:hypothetical protein
MIIEIGYIGLLSLTTRFDELPVTSYSKVCNGLKCFE